MNKLFPSQLTLLFLKAILVSLSGFVHSIMNNLIVDTLY
jgi:hypothetical protein